MRECLNLMCIYLKDLFICDIQSLPNPRQAPPYCGIRLKTTIWFVEGRALIQDNFRNCYDYFLKQSFLGISIPLYFYVNDKGHTVIAQKGFIKIHVGKSTYHFTWSEDEVWQKYQIVGKRLDFYQSFSSSNNARDSLDSLQGSHNQIWKNYYTFI